MKPVSTSSFTTMVPRSGLAGWFKRLVEADTLDREAACLAEVGRLRSGDPLSWLLILTGLAPLAVEKTELLPVALAVAVFLFVGRRRGLLLDVPRSNALAVVVATVAFTLFAVTGDQMTGFSTFLMGVVAVLYFKHDLGRDVQRLYLVSFVLFLVFAHMTLEWSFLILLAVMLTGGVLLMLRYHFPEEIRPGRYGSIVRRLSGPLLASIALSIPIFVVCPRVPVATLNLQRPRHVPGFGDSIRFGEMRAALQSDRLFMTVRSPRGHRWRGTVLDSYGKAGWRRLRNPGDYKTATPGDPILLGDGMRRADLDHLESAEVILEPSDVRVFFSPRWPLALDIDLARIRYDNPRTLLREDEPQARRVRYVVWFGDAPPREAPADLTNRYLRLPSNLPQRVRDEARRIAGPLTDPSAIARRFETYLSETFTYSLDTVTPQGRDPVDHFLFEARTGHCEYFASAMAVMLRALGVPSRVVLGYTEGTHDAASGTWTIYDRNSHAWVEAYLGPQKGWVEYDPTSANGRPTAPVTLAARLGLTDFSWVRSLLGALRAIDFEWQRYVISFSSSMQASVFRNVYGALEDLEMRLRTWWLRQPRWRLWLMAGLIVGLALLFGPLRRRAVPQLARLARTLRNFWQRLVAWLRRPRSGDDLPEDASFWREVVSLLAVVKLTRGRGETPREFARRVSGQLGPAAPSLNSLVDAYYQIMYRGRALDGAQRAQCDTDLAILRACLGAGAKSRTRF